MVSSGWGSGWDGNTCNVEAALLATGLAGSVSGTGRRREDRGVRSEPRGGAAGFAGEEDWEVEWLDATSSHELHK